MKSDFEIASGAKILRIDKIAARLGIESGEIEPYGFYKAKLPLSLIDENRMKEKKLILVSAITPTPAGEGKTTVSIGLCDGLNKIGKRATVVLREPSLGPVFGLKGGATGGGYSQVVPPEDVNLHFTGDFAAVEKANNLLAAVIDNNIQNKVNNLGIDPGTVRWKRVMDINDRSLRRVVTGVGVIPRETGFDITAASEVMAILCLASGMEDLRKRVGNIFIGFTKNRDPLFARDLKVDGAMSALLKDAMKPNLVQTLEGNPAIIHGGPFANIAQGTNSVLATKMGLTLSDYVVTEAGFGFDLGGEKFMNIKCASSGLRPNVVVIVVTARALKYHGMIPLAEINRSNPAAIGKGLENLDKHVENARLFNIPVVVAINRFAGDSDDEIDLIGERCRQLGVKFAVANAFARGGDGAAGLAEVVAGVAEASKVGFKPLYDPYWDLEKKMEVIATTIYGADSIKFTGQAKNDLATIESLGLPGLFVCMAKTQKSFSDNPLMRGRPRDFDITVREIELASGAGFVIPVTGNITRMPGLPEKPASENFDLDADGNISGFI